MSVYNELNENKFTYSTIDLHNLKKNFDFEITTEIKRNKIDKGVFLIFGATKRAFNYIAFDETKFLYGYNNWDKESDAWVKKNGNWQRSNAINGGYNDSNLLKVVKNSNAIKYYINGTFIGEMPLERWYGNRIGIGVNSITAAKAKNLVVKKILTATPTKLIKENSTYFCWIDELNVRHKGSKNGQVLTTIKNGDPVRFLGISGNDDVTATLKGIYSPHKYQKVELKDGTIGWVHGGGLKQIPSQLPIDFELYK